MTKIQIELGNEGQIGSRMEGVDNVTLLGLALLISELESIKQDLLVIYKKSCDLEWEEGGKDE